MDSVEYGIIGGSGLYRMPGFEQAEKVVLKTPFGEPSGTYVLGTLSGRRVAFLPRHGDAHSILPTEVNFRANLYGFKVLGAKAVLSNSAVGSLSEKYTPGDILIPDQLVDWTRHRGGTFFGAGIVAHVGFAEPFCPILRQRLVEACFQGDLTAHDGGTYLCMEGPQFSSRAESHLYRSWGMDVIGMTNAQEAKLAREAELCYATMAMVTDYDCWHPDHDSVRIEDVIRIVQQNAEHAQGVLAAVVAQEPPDAGCACHRALDNAVITPRAAWPESTHHKLRPLLSRIESVGEKS